MTNGGYPDEETKLSVDDDDEVEPDSTGTNEASGESEAEPEPEANERPKKHTHGANSQQLTDSRREAVESQSETDESAESESSNVGLLDGGLTKHELIAFVGGFVASYALAAVFYWGIITSGGFSNVPTPMWILLGVVVLAPLALMFGLQETSSIAGTFLNRGRR